MNASGIQFHESYRYEHAGHAPSNAYTLPVLLKVCPNLGPQSRVLDIGCGNGYVTSSIAKKKGCTVVGIDLSTYGIRIARESCPTGRFEVLAANSTLLENLHEEPFDVVYSFEVIEHLYDPGNFMAGCFAATKSGGTFICSTPYHGYLKNLAISVLGKWDRHANPLYPGGHIKFFSRRTLMALMEEKGFRNLQFFGVGRYPYMWKSMLVSGMKP